MSSNVRRYTKVNSDECIYNSYVDCSEHGLCKKCGWNPEVSAERLRKMQDKLEEANNDLRNRRHARQLRANT